MLGASARAGGGGGDSAACREGARRVGAGGRPACTGGAGARFACADAFSSPTMPPGLALPEPAHGAAPEPAPAQPASPAAFPASPAGGAAVHTVDLLLNSLGDRIILPERA
jgi:hypothetical protein